MSLYEFRMAHLFEDIDRQLRAIFHCQQQYLFFYLDTLEVLRAYPCIKKKHQQHIAGRGGRLGGWFSFKRTGKSFGFPPGRASKWRLSGWS